LVERVRGDARGSFVFKCDPPVEAGSPEAAALRDAGFRRSGGGGFGGVQPRAVMVLDLEPDEDKLLEGFKPKWRYNIRLAERKGVVVTEASREELPAFYDLLVETARRDGFLVRPRSYFASLHDTLEPRGMLRMWLARFQGRPVAGAICFRFGRRVTYVYGASANEHREAMPNHLMQWTMIRWAKAKGATLYDFRGVSPVRDGRPVEPRIAGLNRFKEGFGARYVEYVGELDLPLRPLVWRAWTAGAPAAMRLYKRLKGRSAEAAD
ncbi:MAG: lipid II:glycine glycyltransferase FemX, partial [Actinomycetota bacterium]